jgi:uncharacterized membrane protein
VNDHRNAILRWAEQGLVAAGRVEEAMRVSGALPDRADWRKFIDRLLLWGGSALLAAGVIFFFAYNWKDLASFAKFGLIELLIAVAVGCCAWFGTEKPAGKAALFTASLFTGALLALFGQTYQTGADTFELFGVWAILILPWVIVGRLPALWILFIALADVAVALYFHAFPSVLGLIFGPEKQLWALFVVNSAALILWELFSRYFVWLNERWATRLLGFACGGCITTLAVIAIFDGSHGFNAAFAVYTLCLIAIYVVYRHFIFDLFILAGGVLSIIIFVASVLSKTMIHRGGEGGVFLLIGFVVIGLSALGGFWLKRISQGERS